MEIAWSWLQVGQATVHREEAKEQYTVNEWRLQRESVQEDQAYPTDQLNGCTKPAMLSTSHCVYMANSLSQQLLTEWRP